MKSQSPSPNEIANPNGQRLSGSLELADDGAQDVNQLRSLVDVLPDRNPRPQLSINQAEPITSFSGLLSCDDKRRSLIRPGHGAVGLLDVGSYGRTGPSELVRDLAVTVRRKRRGNIQDTDGEFEGTITKVVGLRRLSGLGVWLLLGVGFWYFFGIWALGF